MSLLTIRQLSHSFGGPILFDQAQLTIFPEERICLLGRNGEGKSTLLKIIAGQIEPQVGEFERKPGLRISFMPQALPSGLAERVFAVVVEGFGRASELLQEYREVGLQLEQANGDTTSLIERMGILQTEIDALDAWAIERRVEEVLQRLELDPDAELETLSGGMKRRVLLARALVSDPDIILLDEPTNHLDIESIAWLEAFILKIKKALVFITHDRRFLQRLATRIVELDRGHLQSYDCDYDTYLKRKEVQLDAEQVQHANFDKKLAKEEAWLKQGIKARRTRNEGRVRSLQKLRNERMKRRNQQDAPAFAIQEGASSGRKVIDVENISFAWGEQQMVQNFTTTIWRGDKIGFIGPNGSGKTTLLNLLIDKLKPSSGSVKHGSKLQIAYFDQHRQQLDGRMSIQDAVADGNEYVVINGQKQHILGYLREFLFPPESLRMPIQNLSGGERNRLLLARLFTQAANLLVLDEPTNDLDLESLELLEDRLVAYQGTLLIVSHDRTFLNNVVTSTIALEGQGRVRETVGGYEEWLRDRGRSRDVLLGSKVKKAIVKRKVKQAPHICYITQREQRDLDALPAKIEHIEAEMASIVEEMASPEYSQAKNKEKCLAIQKRYDELQQSLTASYELWERLEALPRKG